MVDLNEEELSRKQISEQVKILDSEESYSLSGLIDQYGEGLELYVDVYWWYDECQVTVSLNRNRPETDDEYEKRIEKLKAHKAKRKAAAEKRRATNLAKKLAKDSDDRKIYEALKIKFEGK